MVSIHVLFSATFDTLYQEIFLSQQRLQHPTEIRFDLDSATNAILCKFILCWSHLLSDTYILPVEAGLLSQWNLYGTYCFVPAESDLNAMIDTLCKFNAEWQKLQDLKSYGVQNQGHTRPLDACLNITFENGSYSY